MVPFAGKESVRARRVLARGGWRERSCTTNHTTCIDFTGYPDRADFHQPDDGDDDNLKKESSLSYDVAATTRLWDAIAKNRCRVAIHHPSVSSKGKSSPAQDIGPLQSSPGTILRRKKWIMHHP